MQRFLFFLGSRIAAESDVTEKLVGFFSGLLYSQFGVAGKGKPFCFAIDAFFQNKRLHARSSNTNDKGLAPLPGRSTYPQGIL